MPQDQCITFPCRWEFEDPLSGWLQCEEPIRAWIDTGDMELEGTCRHVDYFHNHWWAEDEIQRLIREKREEEMEWRRWR